jgi:cytochrome c oxidase cbb3-type subunit 3
MYKILYAALPFMAVLSVWAQEGAHREGDPRGAPPRPGNLKFCTSSGNPCLEIPAEKFKRGEDQFIQSCGFCHGRNGTGGSGGPNLTRSAIMRHDIDGEEIGKVIRLGRPDKGMPPIPLNDGQISDVAGYLHGRLAEADKISARRPGANFELLLTGDAEKGRAYFNGPGECASCHSPSGDLKGIAGKYSATALEARFLYPSGKKSTATVTDASGKRFTGEVIEANDFDIAIRTAEGWYRSWPASSVTVEVRDPLARHVELLQKFSTHTMRDVLAYLETLK